MRMLGGLILALIFVTGSAIAAWSSCTEIYKAGHEFWKTEAPDEGSTMTAQDVGADQPITISLTRTPCYGLCPTYRVAVPSSGRVEYEGCAHVIVLGTHESDIARSQFAAMVEAVKSAGFGG
jgi:uncharacterized protein DUF6438